MTASTYLVALGSNVRGPWGAPRELLRDICFPAKAGVKSRRNDWTPVVAGELLAASRIMTTRPLGPSQRTYANAVAIVESDLDPLALVARLKAIERAFGRRPGRRWGPRVLDLDVIGWSGGIWASRGLSIPHLAFRTRRFVLAPLVEIAPDWRDPVTGLTAHQLLARLDRRRPRP